MKFRLKSLLACLLLTTMCSCAFAGCKGCQSGGSNQGGSSSIGAGEAESAVSFEKSELQITIGQETYLVASYLPVAELVAVYTSSNPTVATIEQTGKLSALSVGETVKYGEDTAECKVVVTQGKNIPTLYFSNGLSENVTIENTGFVDFASYILFDGKVYQDHTVMYTINDDTVGEVVDGIFTPKKVGSCVINIEATWRGIESVLLKKTFTINVVSNVELFVNDGKEDYILYNLPKVGSQTFATEMDFIVTALENKQKLTYQVEIIQGTDIVKYENNKLKVLNENVGFVLMKVSCQTSLGAIYNLFITINVYTSAPPDCGYFDTDWIEI